MKGQIAFSIITSIGLHVGGALLVPWPEGSREDQDGVAQVILEIIGETPSDETSPAPAEPPLEPAAQTAPEHKVADPLVQETPPVELKSDAPALVPLADSPPAIIEGPTLRTKTKSVAIARAKPAPAAKTAAGATIRGGSSTRISSVRYRERAALSYPVSALRRHIGGSVVLLVEINEDGRATGTSVLRSSGNADLDRAAITCARQSTYEPYRIHGVAQPCRVEAPFKFEARITRQH